MATASLISDRFRELARKNGVLKHTLAIGLDAVTTTKILQWFFRWNLFLLCSIYTVSLHNKCIYDENDIPVVSHVQLYISGACFNAVP